MQGSGGRWCSGTSGVTPEDALATLDAGFRDATGRTERASSSFRPRIRSRLGSPRPQPSLEPSRGAWNTRSGVQYEPLSLTCEHHRAELVPIASIEYERTDFYYDLHVPGPEHYLADGIWSHNTGKSFAVGVILYALMDSYPGIRILVVRKTRTSLTEAFLKTWEEDVLPESEPMLAGPARKQRLSYEHENGSRMVIGGLDNASRLYSTDYDVVYVQEAFEISEDEWQQFRRALRNWGHKDLNFQLLLADTNPDAPGHWLNQRCLNGVTRRIRTKHENNPSLYDAEKGDWHDEGRAYIESLDQLTGVRKRRLRFGEWCAAEGLVWENFDRNIHVVPAPSDYRQFKWFIAGMDWGYTDPGTIEVFGVDHERRIFLLEEYYYVQRPIEWWAERITMIARDLRDRDKRDETDPNNQGLVVVVCDPSRPDAIQLCNDYLSREGFPRIARPADNTRTTTGRGDLAGLDLVRSGFTVPADGIPRIRLSSTCLKAGRDEALAAKRKPCSIIEELPEYTFLKRDDGRPTRDYTDPKAADHGCFVAGTPVLMWDGRWIPIESVREGDFVMTPNGPERVSCSGSMGIKDTIELTFDDGLALRCTPDHPIHQVGAGMTRSDMLPIGSWVSTVAEKHARSLAWYGSGIPKARTGAFATSAVEGHFSIASSTSASTGRYLKRCTSTIGTRTRQTIESRTSNSYAPRITERGIASTLAGSGRTAGARGSPVRLGGHATSAASPSRWRSYPEPGFAPTTASQCGVEGLASTTKSGRASSAVPFSRQTDTLAFGLVARRVVTRSRASRAEVFNLTVEPTHVYFAGGVLVSNCDPLRYICNYVWRHDHTFEPAKERFKPNTYAAVLGFEETFEADDWIEGVDY